MTAMRFTSGAGRASGISEIAADFASGGIGRLQTETGKSGPGAARSVIVAGAPSICAAGQAD
jgi:hypothetical protein